MSMAEPAAEPRAADRPVPSELARRISAAFAPRRWYGNRWDLHYTRTKLGCDPLYPGVCAALRGSGAPVLDLGCGLGLLAHALRADGQRMAYRGIDLDAAKIDRARRAARRAGLPDAGFEARDLADPDFDLAILGHRGNVALLDVLQFVPATARPRLLAAAMAMLAPGSRLVIRTGLADGSRRARLTRAVDVFSRVVGWMGATPGDYPDPEVLRRTFDDAGLRSRFTPLYGRTPFNNWLVVATRPGTTQR